MAHQRMFSITQTGFAAMNVNAIQVSHVKLAQDAPVVVVGLGGVEYAVEYETPEAAQEAFDEWTQRVEDAR